MNSRLNLKIGLIIIFIIFVLSSLYLTSKPTKVWTENYTYQEAMSINDLSVCDHLEDASLKEICILKLIKCSDDDCFLNKARVESNAELCYDIKDDNKRAMCSSSIKVFKIKDDAILQNNISLCLEFEDVSEIENCQDNFYFSKKFNENNISYCDKIIDEVIKNECIK